MTGSPQWRDNGSFLRIPPLDNPAVRNYNEKKRDPFRFPDIVCLKNWRMDHEKTADAADRPLERDLPLFRRGETSSGNLSGHAGVQADTSRRLPSSFGEGPDH